jgi:hypothetical protein
LIAREQIFPLDTTALAALHMEKPEFLRLPSPYGENR